MIKISEFDYYLPPELIAQHPSEKREKSRLILVNRKKRTWEHKDSFDEIINYLYKGDVLVLNNTKVVNARLIGKKETGGKVEILIVKWKEKRGIGLIQASKPPKIGQKIIFNENIEAKILGRNIEGWDVEFNENIEKIMDKIGFPPLPPYIKRKDKDKFKYLEEDKERYQTVFAKIPGAIAAPTAGLHFSEGLLNKIKEKGIEIVYITLHVGIGTFMPVKTEHIEEHKMHEEYYKIEKSTADVINKGLIEGRRIIAVGTTCCRTLETAGRSGRIKDEEGVTDIYIYPGFEFKIIKGLITNFHLPKSTLILLVSAFADKELILSVYKSAIEKKYRFFSYGDAMFIF